MPPGPRRDAYGIVLGDLEVLLKTSRRSYDVAARAVRVGAPVVGVVVVAVVVM